MLKLNGLLYNAPEYGAVSCQWSNCQPEYAVAVNVTVELAANNDAEGDMVICPA